MTDDNERTTTVEVDGERRTVESAKPSPINSSSCSFRLIFLLITITSLLVILGRGVVNLIDQDRRNKIASDIEEYSQKKAAGMQSNEGIIVGGQWYRKE